MAPQGPPAQKTPAKAEPKAAPKKEKKPKVEKEEDEAPKLAKPDRTAFDAAAKVITEKVEKLQKELKSLSAEISGKGAGKDEFFTKKSEIRDKINKESAALNELHSRKDEIQGAAKASKESSRAAMTELKDMKKELQYRTTDEIDNRIASLEGKMMHDVIPLKEEKKIMEEMKQLRKQKPKVTQMYLKEAQAKGSLEAAKAGTAGTKEELDLMWTEINAHKAARDKLYEDLKTLQEERDAQTGDVSGLFDQREKFNALIRAEIQKRNDLRDEFKEAENTYYQYEREQRQARQERASAERAEWQNEKKKFERQRKIDNLDNQPYTHEISIVEQTTRFCKAFLPKEEKAAEEKKEINHDNPDTHLVLASKKDRDDEFYYAPTKIKGKAKKGGAKEGGSGKQPIKHNAVTFKLFKELDLDAPITTDDIPAVLEKLDAKMKFYQDKVKVWEANREGRKRKILAGEDSDEEQQETKEETKEETSAAEHTADAE